MGTQSPPCWQAFSVHWTGSHSSRPTAPGPPVRVLVGHSKQVVWPFWGWKKLRGHAAQGERPVSEYWPAEHLAGTKIHTLQYGFSIQNETRNRNTIVNVMDGVLVIFESHAITSINAATRGLHHPQLPRQMQMTGSESSVVWAANRRAVICLDVKRALLSFHITQ
jgi:hypothetical protein